MASRRIALEFDDDPQEQEDLLARCRLGDPAAQRAFYERYVAFVARNARRLGTPLQDLEDVTQEVLWIAYRKLGRFRGSDPTNWIYRICRSEVQDRHRARRIRQALRRMFGAGPAPAEIESPERVVARHEAEHWVGEVLAAMSPRKRDVFVLFELEGLSGETIAARIGCPVDTVWTRLFNARRQFTKIARARQLLERVRSGR